MLTRKEFVQLEKRRSFLYTHYILANISIYFFTHKHTIHNWVYAVYKLVLYFDAFGQKRLLLCGQDSYDDEYKAQKGSKIIKCLPCRKLSAIPYKPKSSFIVFSAKSFKAGELLPCCKLPLLLVLWWVATSFWSSGPSDWLEAPNRVPPSLKSIAREPGMKDGDDELFLAVWPSSPETCWVR